MTVAALPSLVEYEQDGVSTLFPAPFRFKSPAHLQVVRRVGAVETKLTLGFDYQVTGGATDAGGAVQLVDAGVAGVVLSIRRVTPRAQPMVYAVGDRFPAKSHEGALDQGILIAQELSDQLDDARARAVLAPPGARGPLFDMTSRGVLALFDGVFSLQPLGSVIPNITDLHDDGNWGGAFTTDGAWG